MREWRCSQCQQNFAEEELLQREDNGDLVCPDCAGLWVDEDLSCRYDEW